MNESLIPSLPEEPPPTPIVTTSLAARMVNVIATPTDVFEEIKAGPPRSSNWLVPALLLMLVGWIGSWLVMSQDAVKQQLGDMQEKQFQKLIEKGKMTREQLEAQRPMMEKVSGISQQVGIIVVPVLSSFALPFWWALLVWLVGSKILGGEFGYLKAVEVSGIVSILLIITSVAKTLIIVVTGNLFAGPNLALLLVKDFDPAKIGHGALAAVDILSFWVLAVRSIGLARLSGASTGVAAAWVFGLWLLGTGALMAFGYGVQKLFGGG